MEASINEEKKGIPLPGQGKKKQAPTEYVILEVVSTGSDPVDGTAFKVVGGITGGKPKTFPGATKNAAIKASGTTGGTFVAVPARTFTPITFEVIQKPTAVFEEGGF